MAFGCCNGLLDGGLPNRRVAEIFDRRAVEGTATRLKNCLAGPSADGTLWIWSTSSPEASIPREIFRAFPAVDKGILRALTAASGARAPILLDTRQLRHDVTAIRLTSRCSAANSRPSEARKADRPLQWPVRQRYP